MPGDLVSGAVQDRRMPITLEVHEPRELLALVPYQLGFQPRESLVLVSLRHPDGRVGLVARADLDDICASTGGEAVAARLVEHLRADGAAQVVLVVYTDDPLPGGASAGARARAAARTVRGVAGTLDVAGTWVVGSDGYCRLGCTDPGCCPEQGRPSVELESTQVGAHMVWSGASFRASRDALADLSTVPEADHLRAAAAAVAWTRARSADGANGVAHLDWLERSLAAWRKAVAGEATAAELGQVGAALDDVAVRDAVLVSLVPGSGRLPEQIVLDVGSAAARSRNGPVTGAGPDTGPGASTSAAVGRAVAAIIDPEVGVRPDDATEKARQALERVVGHHDTAGAPGRTLLALVAWWRGDGALAGAHLDRIAPGKVYRLASLVRTALDAGMPPGWAAAARTAVP